ncbi:T cell receptor alpha chain MC.7.G5-like isoform X3 [Cyrtonyx montezumae]|uniref:T cell receptor alpha chain MC.7.G5-like isoform X3 n=1 Tax=Cyrtonyx montezumae TaxID=9017 RepID=UPI0032DA4183
MWHCRAAGLAGLAAVLLVAVSRAQVQQEPSAETSEGTGINITCSHPNIQTGYIIHWYRQLPGRGPAFLVSAFKDSKEVPDPPGRLSVSADRRSSALWLARPRLGDAAVYYCALCANQRYAKLAFGAGTELLVTPNITPSPSVYRLTTADDKDLEMCLITDYSPEKLDLSSVDSKTETVVEVATSKNKHEASYLSTYWAKKDEMKCDAKHEGFGVLKGEDPEAGASTVCITGMSLHFKTDENLNMLTFSQLGLKIIFMKVIIFNVLMTMLMWKKKNECNWTVQM